VSHRKKKKPQPSLEKKARREKRLRGEKEKGSDGKNAFD